MPLPSLVAGPLGRAVRATLVLPFLACASGSPEPGSVAPAAAPAPSGATMAAPGTLADGAYTEDQAVRGAELFGSVCGECHATREFRGTDFFFNWEGSTVGRFVELVVETMPEDDPGSLPMEQYLAITAYILQLNDYPAGNAPLPDRPEVLSGLTFERPGAPAPDPRHPGR